MNQLKNLAVQFLFALLLALPLQAYASAPLSTSIAPMLQKVLPAIVNIRAQIKITDFNTYRELQKQRGIKPNNNNNNNEEDNEQNFPTTFVSVGSGVIVDAENGYLLTNAHVVNDAQTVTVTLSDSRHYTAKIIGLDKPSDVALLQIKAKNLTAIPLGDSTKLKVGDFVAAIGNPFGIGQTVTSGIVSALDRTTLGIENIENFIQTDAPINPGNSGGALIDTTGHLIGINTAILAPSMGSIGIGFAIPANMAKSVMDQFIQYGDVKRGLLGIGAQNISPELANAFNLEQNSGAAISHIMPGSPAQKAGLQIGDIVLSINGQAVRNANDVINTVAFLRVDSKVQVDVLRNKKRLSLNANLTDPKQLKKAIEQSDPFLYGVGLKNISLLSPIHGDVQGVMVVAVEQDSNAWHADLRPGDIITSVNQQKVKSIDDMKNITNKQNKNLLLNVIRGPGAVFLVINKEA
jgi:serine protease Do